MSVLGISSLVLVGLLSSSKLGYCAAKYNVCPVELGTSIHDVFGASGYVQKSIWHRIPCPTFRPTESLDGIIWYYGSNVHDLSTLRLISRDLRGSVVKDSPADERYSMSSDHGLVIQGVEDRDEGSFLCQVIPKATDIRVRRVHIQVIGDTFPGGSSQASSTASFHRGRRQTLPCGCASLTPDAPISVVYWSKGEGVTTDTQIIGARFSDGTTLKVEHDADYSIGSDNSLHLFSLNDVHVQDTQSFWCHVIQTDGTLRNCDVDVQISDQQTPDHALKASSTSFYLLEGGEQTLPCSSWTPGVAACEVQWFKNDTSGRHFLLSSNDVDAESEFELASDFGLIVKSVDGKDAGRYQCDTGGGISGDNIAVRVIDKKFPLDGERVFASSKIDFEAGKNYTLTCQAVWNSAEISSPATVLWSFANPDNHTTTVIGRLNVPGRSKTMSDLRDKHCFSISEEGALLLNMCFQAEDVRYWCHVFPENKLLIRCYVDVLTKEPRPPAVEGLPITIYIIIAVCCCLVSVVGISVCLKSLRKNEYPSLDVNHVTMRMQTELDIEMSSFEEAALNFVKHRQKTINMLQEAADYFDMDCRQAQATKAADSAVGRDGIVLTIDSLMAAAATFTGDLSLFLTAARATAGVAGGLTAAAGTIKEEIFNKKTEEQVKNILADDEEACTKVKRHLEQIETTVNDLSAAGKAATSIYDFVRVGTAVTRIGKAADQSAVKADSTAKTVMAAGSILFSVVSIPIDLYTIIDSSVNLQDENVPELVQSINQIINELRCPSKKDMKNYIMSTKEYYEQQRIKLSMSGGPTSLPRPKM